MKIRRISAVVCLVVTMLVGVSIGQHSTFFQSNPSDHTQYIDKQVKYCVYTYAINTTGSTQFRLCSQKQLSSEQVKALDGQLALTAHLYPRWLASKNSSWNPVGRANLSVYLISSDQINDTTMFPRHHGEGRIAGRYVKGAQRIWITHRVFEPEGYTDFPHEIAHWMNEEVGISDHDQDEGLAGEFEKHYADKTPVEYNQMYR